MGDLQSDKRINIVMHQSACGVHVNPDPHILLEPGDTILVIAPMEPLLMLEAMNHSQQCPDHSPVKIGVPANPQPGGVGGAPASTPVVG